MSMQPTDRIIAASRGDVRTVLEHAAANGAARQPFLAQYVNAVFELCDEPGTPDAAIVIAQSSEETAGWTSFWWTSRGNPAGIGITGDPEEDTASEIFENGLQSGSAHIAHLLLYATGTVNAAGLGPMDDPRYVAYVDAHGLEPTATTIAGLAGTWAADTGYAGKICQHGNAIWPNIANQEQPMADLVFGTVPHPAFQDRPITKPEGNGQNDLGQRSVRGVVWHRILGTLWGTDSYFRGPVGALTDYGVGVQATDGDGNDGVILRWNDPLGSQSGWASGVVSSPYGDGAAFVTKYGIDAVNRDQASIEISGNYDTPLSEKARQSVAALTAYWADQARIPWSAFPNIPGDGFSFVRWHQEFTIGTGKVCPGQVVMNETSALIQRVAGIMKRYQTDGQVATPKPPDYAASDLPAWFEESTTERYPTDNSHDGVKLYVARRNYVATAGTRRLSKPDGDAERSGPNVAVREKVHGERITGDNKWVLTVDGHYVSAAKLSPRLTVRS